MRSSKKAKNIDEFDSGREFGTALNELSTLMVCVCRNTGSGQNCGHRRPAVCILPVVRSTVVVLALCGLEIGKTAEKARVILVLPARPMTEKRRASFERRILSSVGVPNTTPYSLTCWWFFSSVFGSFALWIVDCSLVSSPFLPSFLPYLTKNRDSSEPNHVEQQRWRWRLPKSLDKSKRQNEKKGQRSGGRFHHHHERHHQQQHQRRLYISTDDKSFG